MMNRHCFICESKAILTKDAAMGVAVLACVAKAYSKGVCQAQVAYPDGESHHGSSLEYGYVPMQAGLGATLPALHLGLNAAADVATYYFGVFNCLCLRCGARFDEANLDTTAQSPTST